MQKLKVLKPSEEFWCCVHLYRFLSSSFPDVFCFSFFMSVSCLIWLFCVAGFPAHLCGSWPLYLPVMLIHFHCVLFGFLLDFFGGPFTQVLLYCILLLTLSITGPHSQTNAQFEYKSVSLQLNTEKTKAIISYFSGKEDTLMVTGLRL